jgi:N-methylhydantoinase B
MRFSDNGYYIEKYVKCANCGLLVYDQGVEVGDGEERRTFCSDWCIRWAELRDSGQEYFQLPIVQPAIKTRR